MTLLDIYANPEDEDQEDEEKEIKWTPEQKEQLRQLTPTITEALKGIDAIVDHIWNISQGNVASEEEEVSSEEPDTPETRSPKASLLEKPKEKEPGE
jgi:hypothetical protein